MSALKYKPGDKVRIKNLDWYNENKNNCNEITFENNPHWRFVANQSDYCGQIATITDVSETAYRLEQIPWNWTDEMIEGIVEEESEKKLSDESWKPSKEEMDVLYSLAYITNQYDEHKEEIITRLYQDLKREFFNGSSYENMFPDTEDDVRRRSTIQVLEYARSLDNYNQYGKEDIDKNIAWLEKQGKSALEARTDNELVEEEVGLVDVLSSRWVNEFNLPDGYILKDENGNVINATKIVLEKKKKEYPKTYEECCKILGLNSEITDSELLFYYSLKCGDYTTIRLPEMEKFEKFIQLYLCRNAYWKLYGEEMGLGKPWEPSKDKMVYSIYRHSNEIETDIFSGESVTFEFPTAEMRDTFKENFDPDIEFCKVLL